MPVIFPSAADAWITILKRIMMYGTETSPRGFPTKEILCNSIAFDMNYPVIKSDERKLSYKFMAAEALWIITGDDRVETIAPYNKNISQFSDDGKVFFGAYGPKIIDQIPYATKALLDDPDTRQSVINIWRENPPKSKDIPCTITMVFHIRDNKLHTHVTMRSSDAWLGVPYDFFNYTAVSINMIQMLRHNKPEYKNLELGHCYWTAASSHIYARNFESVKKVLEDTTINKGSRVPLDVLDNYSNLVQSLMQTRAIEKETIWKIRG